MNNVRDYLGEIDIYLCDQILKQQFTNERIILDASCDGGRNIVHFLRNGNPVFAVDENFDAVCDVRRLAFSLAPKFPP